MDEPPHAPAPRHGTAERRATALWCRRKDTYALVDQTLPHPAADEVVVEALYSAVSRGTERLVLSGEVPRSEWQRMRCPNQDGAFPFPVKYGYALVGRVVEGGSALCGRNVFALHPHQSRLVLPRSELTAIDPRVPAQRATLVANVETALTVVWDAGLSLCDRALVVGCGVVGLLVARLMARVPGAEVFATDRDEGRAEVARAMGVRFAAAHALPTGLDVAVNASGTGEGLAVALGAVGREGRVVEASWHGTRTATLALGGAFHAERLAIVSSQVGSIPPLRAPRWTHARRREAAAALLLDDALDALIDTVVPFAEAPSRLPALVLADPGPLAVVLDYR